MAPCALFIQCIKPSRWLTGLSSRWWFPLTCPLMSLLEVFRRGRFHQVPLVGVYLRHLRAVLIWLQVLPHAHANP